MTKEMFTSVVERSNQRLFLLALSFTHNHEDSEDICQNVFIKLWKYEKEFESNEHLEKWLTVVTINEAKNALKRAKRILPLSGEAISGCYSFDRAEQRELFEAVMALSEKESSVIQLYYYEEMSVKEIADALGIGESAVKARLSRGREHLRNKIGDDFNE